MRPGVVVGTAAAALPEAAVEPMQLVAGVVPEPRRPAAEVRIVVVARPEAALVAAEQKAASPAAAAVAEAAKLARAGAVAARPAQVVFAGIAAASPAAAVAASPAVVRVQRHRAAALPQRLPVRVRRSRGIRIVRAERHVRIAGISS